MINEQIRDKEIRLIGADGEQLGIVSTKEALKIAEEAGLDLVKIAPTAKPPVCKVIDYGKYRYELARKEKEAKKMAKIVEGCTKHDSGVYFKILKEGKGNPTGKGKKVSVEYKGYLPEGNIFDATKEFHPQGHEPLNFTTDGGEMIPGFDIMVQEMKLGETRKMVIPPELAYGPYGIPQAGIPGNAYICFDVTLIKN